MIALKKVYGDELLRLALILSLLKTDPSDYLHQEAQLLSAGLHISNGTDWSLENEAQTFIRPTFVHPKSLDNILMDYERRLFEELNSLGRYNDAYSDRMTFDRYDRISNINGGRPAAVLHTYLLNNVATDTVAPSLLESVGSAAAPDRGQDGASLEDPFDPHDGVSDDANVAHEVKVSQEETEGDSLLGIPESPLPGAVVTISPSLLHNRTGTDVFEEIESRSFDVDDFLVTPPIKMHIKKEPEETPASSDYRTGAMVKKEREREDVYSDDAMDDFVPYFAEKSEHFDPFSESVFNQNVADLQDYDETKETLREFQSNLDILDVKQQQEDLEQYLLENTSLDLDSEVYDLAPLFEEELVLDVKRERASTSFTSVASSSGVSDMDLFGSSDISSDDAVGATETVTSNIRVKTEPHQVKMEAEENSGDELTQEDMDLIEVLWKQDVDMGFCLQDPLLPPAGPQATKVEHLSALSKEDQAKISIKQRELEQEDIAKVKASLLESPTTEEKEVDPWAGLSYTVDTETGEYVLQGELPTELVASEESRFSLLEEALQLAELEDVTSKSEQPADDVAPPPTVEQESATAAAAAEPAKESEGEEDEMLHPAMARHAPAHPHAHHPHHPLAGVYHHQSIMRQMSVEQRWQDLASLLTIPPPPGEHQYHQGAHQYHHHTAHPAHPAHHNIGSGGYPHAHNYGPLAPPPEKHDNYGASGPLDGAPGYKLESHNPHQQHDGLYYQHPQGAGAVGPAGPAGPGATASDMNGTSDGFLQSILNDEDLQLMDMAMNEGMYTMRMLDGAVVPHSAHAPLAPQPHTHTHMMIHERDSQSDSAVSSMGSERVPSLSDGEWCDAGSDSAQEYHSSKFRPYDASLCRSGPSVTGGVAGVPERIPPHAPPQKKHHMFGKRCFQEQPPSNLEPLVPEPRPQPVIKYEYPEACAPYPHERPLPLGNEYGIRHQNAHHPHLANMPTAQPALDLNSAPSLLQSGGIGVADMARYGYATPERVRHNHTYSAPHSAPDARPSARDKRVRRMTDGSMSDSSSTPSAGGGGGHHISRDEKRAKALGIPMTVHDIINLPMDEFNERLSKHDLSEAQLSLIRDIRRRGKNKVAAQNCRKRKLDQITSLADEVRTVRDRKQRLQRDHQSLLAERQRVKDRFAALYRHVFQNLRDGEGRPVSSAQYSLQQAADGNVVLVPKMQHPSDHHMNRSSDDEMDRKKHFDQ